MRVLLFVGLCSLSTAGPPPPEPRNMPGDGKGRVQTRWLAPSVSVTTRSVAAERMTLVQWFTPQGKLARDLAGPNVYSHSGYVYEGGTIYAVNGDWKIVLPHKPGPPGYITATEDSRTFVHEFHPKEGEIAADIYVDGKLAGTVGPYLQYQGQDVQLGADGSLALLAWKDDDKKTAQVVVAGPDAKVRFRADCDGPVLFPEPAPEGNGVVVQTNAGGDAGNTFTFYTKGGKVSSLNVGPNAGLLTWLPRTTTAVFHSSIGYDYRFHMVDWSTGKRVWDVADPNHARVPGALPPVAVTKGHLLIGGLEYVPWGDHQESVRSIYAVDSKTGQVVAHWLPSPFNQASRDGGRFLQLGPKLFLVTDDEFAEVAIDDIAAKKNGWQ
ncbi:MAG TPA: hypothetical protein VG013_23625 [Gemmataceae bacterium]|nr:hypothetical protein [Gemmataceae bacterium]